MANNELERDKRVEFHYPDFVANPYLAFVCMLNAGLKGIEENYSLPEPFEKDAYHLSPGEINIDCDKIG